MEPDEDVRVRHLLDDPPDVLKVTVQLPPRHARRQSVFLLHHLDQVPRHAGETDETIHGKRRTSTHPQRRQDGGIGSEQLDAYIFQVLCRTQSRLDSSCRPQASRPVGFRRKLHEPVVVHVYGLRNVRFPPVRLVPVDRHHFLPGSFLHAHERRWMNYEEDR